MDKNKFISFSEGIKIIKNNVQKIMLSLYSAFTDSEQELKELEDKKDKVKVDIKEEKKEKELNDNLDKEFEKIEKNEQKEKENEMMQLSHKIFKDKINNMN